MEFVGDGLLGEVGWNESNDCGCKSGRILSVSATGNAGEGVRGGAEGGG